MQTKHGFVVVVVVVVRPLLRSQSSLPPSPQIAARAWISSSCCCCCCIVILGFCFCACSGEFFFNDGKPWRWEGRACGTGRQWTLPDSAGGDRRGSALQYAASCYQHCRWSVPTANLRPQDQESDHVAGKKESGPSLGCGYLGQQLPSSLGCCQKSFIVSVCVSRFWIQTAAGLCAESWTGSFIPVAIKIGFEGWRKFVNPTFAVGKSPYESWRQLSVMRWW